MPNSAKRHDGAGRIRHKFVLVNVKDTKREEKYDAMKDRMRKRLEEKERKVRKNKNTIPKVE